MRNKGDGLLHQIEKALKDLGEKVSGDERAKVEGAIGDLKAVVKGDDKDAIERKTQALEQAAAAVMQKLYTEQAAGAGDGTESGAGAGGGDGDDDVVDAEFEEVKDKDRRG